MTSPAAQADPPPQAPSFLLRRLTLWVLFALATLEALTCGLIALLMDSYLAHTLDGKPLPILTAWLLPLDCRYALFPAVVFVLALIFTVWKRPSADLTLFLAVVLGSWIVGSLLVFTFGMLMPVIPEWCS